ncbi:MAG: tetratricopeptide repeat protein [Flavobacteriales bacterium]
MMNIAKAVVLAIFCSSSLAIVAQTTKDEAIKKTLNERYESAEADLNELIAREPNNAELYHAAGDNYLYWGEMDKAEAMYRKGMEVAATNPLNYAGLGRVAWIRGDALVNTTQFAKAVEIMGARSNKVPKPIQQLTYLKMAEVYLQHENKNLEKALEYINNALNLDENNPEVYVQLGEYYSERDGINLTNALMQYNRALEKNPKYTRALLRKGVVHVKIAAWDDGLNYFNEIIAIDPTFAPVYREKAELLYKAGRYTQAVEAYAKYLELNNSCRVQQRYASFIFLTKDYKKAGEELEKAMQCNSSSPYLYRLLGYTYFESGDYTRSQEYLDKFMEMAKANGKPKIDGYDLGYQGKLLAKAGQDSLALLKINEAISADSNYVDGYGELAAIYQKQKKYDMAAAHYQKKIEKNKEPVLLDYYYLGTNRYYNKEFKAADDAFAMCEKKYPDATFWRGRCNNRMELDYEHPVGLGKPFFENYITRIGKEAKAIESNKKFLTEAYSYLGFQYFATGNYNCSKAAYYKVLEMDAAHVNATKALTDSLMVIAIPDSCALLP